MSTVMRYRVREGKQFGANHKYGPGDIVRLTEYEAKGFLDLLILDNNQEKERHDLAVAPGTAGTAGEQVPAPNDAESSANTDDNTKTVENPDDDEQDTTPTPTLSELWEASAPTLAPRILEVLARHQLAPAVVAGMTDEALMGLDGIGPSTVRAIREATK